MTLPKPYKRIYRPAKNPPNTESSLYFQDELYAPGRTDYIRAYRLLEKDLVATFDYVEPTQQHRDTFSHQFYQLLIRACTEFETNAKVILGANGYPRTTLNISDYWKIQPACRLSEYVIATPYWKGPDRKFRPFQEWHGSTAFTTSLWWYKAYNDVKHNRAVNFQQASLFTVLNAISGVFVLLFAQFHVNAFYHRQYPMYQIGDQGEHSHGDSFFEIIPPSWSDAECYEFDWAKLKTRPDPVQDYPFPP